MRRGGGGACAACLSAARALAAPAPPGARLLGALLPQLVTEELSDMYICWECRAVLRKTLQFQARAARARDVLESARMQQDTEMPIFESLSTLQYSHKTSYDFIITESDSLSQDEITKEEQTDDEYTHETVEYESDNNDEKVAKPAEDLFHLLLPFKEIDDIKEEDEPTIEKVDNEKIENNERENEEKNYIKQKRQYTKHFNAKPYTTVKINTKKMLEVRKAARIHHKYLEAIHKCDKCIIWFRSASAYKTHVKIYHSKNATYSRCNICSSTFSKAKAMKYHRRLAHFRYHQCNYCSEVFLTGKAMCGHISHKHYSGPTYECDYCERKYNRRTAYEKHLQGNHFECDKCGKIFDYRHKIEKHLKYHETVCTLCNTDFKQIGKLKQHNYMVHQEHDITETAYCVECDKQFRHQIAYKSHLYTMHREKKQNHFPCPHCDKIYRVKFSLKNHINYEHLNIKDFNCHVCGKSFPRKSAMKLHVKLVHEKKLYPKNKFCDICGRGFSTNRILINHLRTHTGERPYECEHCSSAFAQKAALRSHVKHIHLRERPYACEHCNMTFAQNVSLHSHVKRVHLQEPENKNTAVKTIKILTFKIQKDPCIGSMQQ